MSTFRFLPCLGSPSMAASRRRELDLPRDAARRSAGLPSRRPSGVPRHGCRPARRLARCRGGRPCAGKVGMAPQEDLPRPGPFAVSETRVQVANETTRGAAFRLAERGCKPLALNFASGIHPGGAFLHGARAQEEVLCRSSALSRTPAGDPLYQAHRQPARPDSTDWAICSPAVPVFRKDDGTAAEPCWLSSFLTCAAPHAPAIGQPEAGDLLQKRILRARAIAASFGCEALVLGAWGCGAQRSPPDRCRFPAGAGKRLRGGVLRHRVRRRRLVAGSAISRAVPHGLLRCVNPDAARKLE